MSLRNGESILSFDDLVELSGDARLNVDPKADQAVRPLLERLRRDPALRGRVCVGSFETRRILAFRSELPDLATGLGSSEIKRLVLAVRTRARFNWPDSAVAAQVPVSALGLRIVTEAFVEFTQRAGRQVHVWTVDEESVMHQLLDLGVNGIMTDQPSRLRDVLRDRGIW